MILRDRYDGREAPFQGDRELFLRHLPADARIVSARITVTPVDLTGGTDPFAETIHFRGALGDWGATKTATAGAVEVDFHARRTLVGVQGSGLNGTSLQADLGGAFLAVGADGAVGASGPPFTANGNSVSLPGLTVTRLRLTGGGNPDVTSVRVRSIPSNVTLALRGRPSFWFHAGEMATPQTTTDFVTVLAAYLPEAEVKDGYYFLPFVLHADGIARLDVVLEIEYVRTASLLPNGLVEATLPFAFGSLPASSTTLTLSLPGNAALARGGSLGRALGAFEGTRVALGPTGVVPGPERTGLATPSASLAQPITVPATIEAVAVDLLLAAAGRAARLTINLVEDLDGRPGGRSFWPTPVAFALSPETSAQLAWVSVALPRPFQLGPETTYWLVLQSLDGDATWSARDAAAGSPGLHRTDDGGLSWRRAGTAPLAALFRLRDQPQDFRMPIELEVGAGETARRVSLRRFDPQRRVELFMNLPEIEDAFEQALAAAAPSGCPRGEHLADGGFEQWVKVGNRLGQAFGTAREIPRSDRVAVSPDGRRAYVVGERVAGDGDRGATLYAIELGCGRIVGPVSLGDQPLEEGPVTLVIHPGGTRAYVFLNEQLRVIDLESLRVLGEPVPFPMVLSAAVSPDGGLLYLGMSLGDQSSLIREAGAFVVALEPADLETLVLGGTPDISRPPLARLGANRDPVALVPSADGSRLWALLRGETGSELLALETPGLRILHATSIPLPGGATPRDLALTADGARAVAVRDDQVDLVDLAGRTVTATLGVIGDHVAIEPDGRRAFVSGNDQLRVIDLERGAEIAPPISVGEALSGLAITPQGDRVLLTDSEMGGLHVVPIGVPAPAEWTVVSGRVTPACLGEPSRPVAVLGGRGDDAPATDSIVAQVVPIAPACAYELTFDGSATGEGAVAEVLWHGEGCAPAGSASIPIEPLSLEDLPAESPEIDNPPLRPHRLLLDPPAGVTQAEVRFRVPFGGAAVTAASLQARDAVLAAGDLRPAAAGSPDPWTQTAAVPGFTRLPAGAGTRLRNAGSGEAVLAQTVAVTAGSPFILEVRGRSLGPLRPVAAAGLHWLAGDAPLSAPAVTLEVPPGSFDGLAASGTVPAGADRAELRLTVPPAATLDVERLDLRFPDFVTVPVNFIAEAPGELSLLGWQLAWNERDLPPPPVPATGLCPPTRTGRSVLGPSTSKEDGCDPCDAGKGAAYCPSCEAERPLEGAQAAVTASGRPAFVGTCTECGARIAQPGGRAVAVAVSAGTPLPVLPMGARALARPAVSAAPPVTRIIGIGRARERLLRAAGFNSLEAIATSDPATLRRLLPGVTETAAAGFIASARALLRSPSG